MDFSRQPSHRLTFEEAVQVWLLYWQGHFQNRIAAMFDTNPSRVNDVIKERKHAGSKVEALRRKR
jgi:hypothetical protein